MNNEIQYRIVRIETKKHENPYHDMMAGKRCVVASASVGYRGCLIVQTLEDCCPRWFSTSPVERVAESNDTLTIETMNTIYTLVKEDCDDLS